MPVEIKEYSTGDSLVKKDVSQDTKKVDYTAPKGKVTLKKSKMNSLGKSVIQGSIKDAITVAITDLIVPAGRDLLFNVVNSVAQTLIYGESEQPSVSNGVNRIPYSSISNYNRVGRPTSRVQKIRQRPEDGFIFERKSDADTILDELRNACDSFGVVSVQSLYEICDKTAPYTANKYGWMNLDDARVERTRDGYTLKLPRSMPLD